MPGGCRTVDQIRSSGATALFLSEEHAFVPGGDVKTENFHLIRQKRHVGQRAFHIIRREKGAMSGANFRINFRGVISASEKRSVWSMIGKGG